MNTTQNIFNDHYEEMIYILHPRDSVIENVNKMLNCGDPSFGGSFYACPGCRFLKFRPFRCHSRFCPTCGNKYSIERATAMSFKLIGLGIPSGSARLLSTRITKMGFMFMPKPRTAGLTP